MQRQAIRSGVESDDGKNQLDQEGGRVALKKSEYGFQKPTRTFLMK